MTTSWKGLDQHVSDTGQQIPATQPERWVSYALDDLYPEWHNKAHCAGVGHEYYFGNEEDGMRDRISLTRNASKLCDVCPVFVDCLRHALTQREEFGVWAGTSGRSRRKLFTMMDTGETDVEQIIEVMTHERRGAEPPRALRSDVLARGDGLHDEAPGDVAL